MITSQHGTHSIAVGIHVGKNHDILRLVQMMGNALKKFIVKSQRHFYIMFYNIQKYTFLYRRSELFKKFINKKLAIV